MKQNPKISPERIEALRQQFGLDRSWPEQYGRWLWRILHKGILDEFCLSTLCGIVVVGAAGSNTTTSAIASLIVTWDRYSLGYHRRRQTKSLIDCLLRVISYAGQGFPSFITALLLLIFAQYTSPLPSRRHD